MKIKNKLFILLAILALTLAACGDSDDESDKSSRNNEDKQEVTTITISDPGGGTLLFADLEADFEAAHPTYDLNILPDVATVDGVRGVSQGLLDMAIMARLPNETETETMPSLIFVQLGKVGLSVLAHPTVPIDSLTIIEGLGIFSGGITNWSELGGPDEDIVLFVPDEQEGVGSTSAAIGLTLPEGFAVPEEFGIPETAVVVTDIDDLQSSIESTEYSITYDTSMGSGIPRDGIKIIQLNGINPTEANYPLSAPFGIGYLPDNAAKVQVFVDWLSSEEGQTALANLGVILE